MPLAALLVAAAGCARRAAPPGPGGAEVAASEGDGEDDGAPRAIGPGLARLARADRLAFEALPPPPATAHPRVCDVVGLAGAVYASHATSVINRTGARIHRFEPATGAWSLAFDYDAGAPAGSRGGGGQGLPRLRVQRGRVVAVDGDSTSRGFFGASGDWLETYLFQSDPAGRFAPADVRPPAGLVAMPGAFHLFDTIVYRGLRIVSGGAAAVPGRSGFPAGLWFGAPDAAVLERRLLFGFDVGVVRATYLHRFDGRLYVGVQNNEARARFDLAVIDGDPRLGARARVVQVTPAGGWLTRRWASGGGALYWLAAGHRDDPRPATLFASRDGREFAPVALPPAIGAPEDVAVVGDTLWVLGRDGLGRGRANREATQPEVAAVAVAPPGDPFGAFDAFCSAPLAVAGDALYAGSTRDGRLFRLVEVRPPARARGAGG